MSVSELKLYIINGSTIGVTTYTQIEDWLKIILLIVTIGYSPGVTGLASALGVRCGMSLEETVLTLCHK